MNYPTPRHWPVAPGAYASRKFVQGFVATGCLAALQSSDRPQPASGRRVLRRALQGAAALAAGGTAALAWERRDYASLLIATAAGAAVIAACEHLLPDAAPSRKERDHG